MGSVFSPQYNRTNGAAPTDAQHELHDIKATGCSMMLKNEVWNPTDYHFR